MKILWLALFSSLLASMPSAFADNIFQDPMSIPEFHQVSDGIYRGGHPESQGLQDLAKLGVKTVIDLENDDTLPGEIAAGQQVGLQMISKPMSRFWAPDDKLANEVLGLMADPTLRPIFIHCTLGQDRTGLMVGLYRVFQEKWDPAKAYQEMLDDGFKSKLLFSMDRYFRQRTGFGE